jgi:hypothetical protein
VVVVLAGCRGAGSGSLVYSGPTEQAIAMGERIPGSNIQYVGYSEAGAEVLINDQRALKKVGDSLDWRGAPVPGVQVEISQRVLAISADRLQTVGTVKVTVSGVQPELASFPDQPAFDYKVAVSYTVRKGDIIPGTLLSYGGKAEDGAEFVGVNGYPFRKFGDSLTWMGRLRGNTYLDMTLRVIAYTEEFVSLGGLATIGLTQ